MVRAERARGRDSQSRVEDAAGEHVGRALAGLQDEGRLEQEQGLHLCGREAGPSRHVPVGRRGRAGGRGGQADRSEPEPGGRVCRTPAASASDTPRGCHHKTPGAWHQGASLKPGGRENGHLALPTRPCTSPRRP